MKPLKLHARFHGSVHFFEKSTDIRFFERFMILPKSSLFLKKVQDSS